MSSEVTLGRLWQRGKHGRSVDPGGVGSLHGGERRRRDIEGLRGVAVVLVVLYHSELDVSGGFIGVDVFFVISGFVVTGMIMREIEATGSFRLPMFYSGRVRRLLPALAALLVAVAIASALLLSPVSTSQKQTARTGVATLVLAANAELYNSPQGYFDTEPNPLLHMWSLAVEAQFYLFFPPLVFLGWRVGRRRLRRLTPTTVVAVLLSLTACTSFAVSLGLTGVNAELAFYSSHTRAWEFAAGGILALASHVVVRIGRVATGLIGVMGAALIAVAAWRVSAATAYPGTAALLPVVGSIFVIAAGPNASVSTVLATRPAVWIGKLSYGWYLWHWPVIVFAEILWPSTTWALPVAAVASLLPTWLSYRFVESPLRRNMGLLRSRRNYLTAACLAIPIASCLALGLSAKRAQELPIVANVLGQVAPHADVVRSCNSLSSLTDNIDCSWRSASPARGTIVLVGDSNAGQFTEPVAQAANGLHLDFAVATYGGCPFVDLDIQKRVPYDYERCRRFVADMVTELERRKPALVVMASASAFYVEDDEIRIRDPRTGQFEHGRDAKAVLWERGLETVLARFDQADVPVLVVHSIPYFADWDLRLCPASRLYRHVERCGISRSRTVVEEVRKRSIHAERNAVAAFRRHRVLDLASDLCSPDECVTNVGRRWVYRDGQHLTVAGALALTDRFAEVIRVNAEVVF